MKKQLLPWEYNPQTQTFETPSGPLELSTLLVPYFGLIENRLDFRHEWLGWKLRRQYIIGPGGIRLTPRTASQMWKKR